MSLQRAQQIVARASAIFDSHQKEMLKEMLEEIYSDMGGATTTVVAGTDGFVPEGGGTVSIDVVESPTGTFTINLSPIPE